MLYLINSEGTLHYYISYTSKKDPTTYFEKKYQGPFMLDNLITSEINFRPSKLLEFHSNQFTDNIDKFFIFTLNDFNMAHLPDHPSSLHRDPIIGSDYFSKIQNTYDESPLI